jgi:hypothetical protein
MYLLAALPLVRYGGSGGVKHSRARKVVIEGSGHVLPLEMIAKTASAIRPWVAQTVNSGRKIMRALRRNGPIGLRRRD